MKKVRPAVFLVQAGLIGAAYVILSYVSSLFGLAFGPVQFRISEALCILPVFFPSAIPGLVIGCLITNLGSPLGLSDVIFGTLSTLLSAICTYALRKVRFRGLPLLAFVPPIVFNSLICGAQIAYFMMSSASFWPALFSEALSVCIGETLVCAALGLPLAILLQHQWRNV